MTSSERDDALQYLLSKLKSEDGWSCANLAWNEDRLTVIADQFGSFDGTVKSKLLLSFLAMTPRIIHQCRDEMLKLLRLARRDGNEWVRLFAAVLAPFPESQTISVESSSSASEVVEEIGEFLNNSTHTDKDLVPQEYPYLGNQTLKSACSFAPPTNHAHFTLRAKPRASSQLRTEILHRAEAEMANPSALIKNRLLNRKNSFPATTSFVSLQRSGSMPSSSKTTPIPGLLQRRHREKGTKLLEIDEVPMAGSRKKRRISEVDPHARLDAKRAAIQQAPPTPTNPKPTTPMVKTPLNLEPPATPTPDYAAGLGLGPDDSAIQPHTPTLYTSHLTNPFTPLQSPTTPSPTTPTPTTPSQFKTTPTTPGQFKPTFHQLSQLAVAQQTSSALQQPATPTTTSAPFPRPALTQASVMISQQPARATQSRDRRALIQARLSQLSSSSVSTQKHQLLQGSKVADLLQTALLKKVLPSQEQPGTLANVAAGTGTPTSVPSVAVSLPQPVQLPKNEPVAPAAAQPVTQPQAKLQVAATAELVTATQPVTSTTSTAADRPQMGSAVQAQAQLAASVTRPSGTTGLNLSAQQLVAHQQQLVNQQQALFNRLQQQAQRGAAVAVQPAQVNAVLAQAQPASSSLTAQQQRQLLAIQQSQLAGQQQARAQTQPSQAQAHPNQPQAQQPLQQQQPAQEASGSRLKISRSHLAIAEDIFREAPHLSKQQRILILAFMAGSRSNPFPGRDVVTFKLSSRQMPEVVDGPQGNKVIRTVQLETVFEMNYTTGTWRKLQVKRVIE